MLSWWIVLAVVGPALGYALLLYCFDLHEREPVWALLVVFIAGALLVPVSARLSLFVDDVLPYVAAMRRGDRTAIATGCYLVIAPIEELTKLLCVAMLARKRLMDEPVDGVIYAGTAALGFAAAEGLLAATSNTPATLLMRGLLATPGHLCFASLWGAGLGAVRYWGRAMVPFALAALAASILAHGTYDFLLIADGGSLRGAIVAVLAACALVMAVLFRALLRASPYRGVPLRAGVCARCGRPHEARMRFCAGCGASLAPPLPMVPLDFTATLLAFSAQSVALVSGTVLVASLLGESGRSIWERALSAPGPHTLLGLCVVSFGAAVAGLSARALGRRSAVLEALVSTALVLLCALLFFALTSPSLLTRVVFLGPFALVLSGSLARAPAPRLARS